MSSLVKSYGVLLIIALVHLVLRPLSVSCAHPWPPQSSPPQAAAVEEEKIRLGSMPPSCHNRCNTCNPCTAVEVPTLPGPSGGLAQVEAGELRRADQAEYSQYNSNYKPLGWKCRCRGRVYNP